MTDARAVEEEVERLHRFFQGWFSGDAGISLSEFTDVLDEGFTIVSPSGMKANREEIVTAVQGAFGSSTVAIGIENMDTTVVDTVGICRYVEVHRLNEGISRRLSTAVLRIDKDHDGRPMWLTVHETWIDSTGDGS
ncbi:MAG: hypothetical protein M3132_06430 [Actinomycetia bacterium]|nr:hypothetical protein [Actinomycetes bacterium]